MAVLVGNIKGPPGVQGPQGTTGPEGPTGPTGADGAQGPQGPKGDTGAQGIQGPVGPEGPQGPAGTGVKILGSVPNQAALPDPTTLQPGDGYITEDTGHLWTVVAEPPPQHWTDSGNITGPAGPTGPTGPAGPEGPAGAQGPQGIQGVQGPVGATGAQGATGSRGSGWFTDAGPPVEPISGSIAGDLYLDVTNGDVYELAGA